MAELSSVPLTYLVVNGTKLSANTVTRIGGALGLGGSVLFLAGQSVAAGIAYLLFLWLDCTDGTVARLRGTVSLRGADLDLWSDRLCLFAAVLAFSAVYARSGHPLAAWLCGLYLATHYLTDLHWLMAMRQRTELPPQFEALKAQLDEAGTRHRPRVPQPLQRLVRVAGWLTPSAWVCNIAFLLLPGFTSLTPVEATAVPLLMLIGTLTISGIRNWTARRARRAV
jgi:phosphatidylglycerophosphate synthase